jgi:hypothetical protein
MALFAPQTQPQESGSRTDDLTSRTATTTAPVAASGPSAALRDVLLAACSQNAADFSRFLTLRSNRSTGSLQRRASHC